MADNLTEVRANGVLGLWCQAGKELVGIQACVLDQLLCCANNRACNITLEGLSLKGQSDIGEALWCLCEDGWVVPVEVVRICLEIKESTKSLTGQ